MLRILPKTDVPEVVLVVKRFKALDDFFHGNVLVEHGAVLRVHDKDYTLSLDIVVTKHVVDGHLRFPVDFLLLWWWLR